MCLNQNQKKALRKEQNWEDKDEIAKKEKMISLELFKRYFGYSGPSDMYRTSNKARATRKMAWVNEIENRLTGWIEPLKKILQVMGKK